MVFAKLIISLAQVGVREDLVGFADSLELFVCAWIVWVLICEEGKVMSAWRCP